MIKTALHTTKMKGHSLERNQTKEKKKSPAASHIPDQVPKNKNSTQVNFDSEMIPLQVRMVVAVAIAIIINIHTLCAYVHNVCVGLCAIKCLWRSEDNFKELLLSFQLYVASRDPTQVSGLYDKHIYPLG